MFVLNSGSADQLKGNFTFILSLLKIKKKLITQNHTVYKMTLLPQPWNLGCDRKKGIKAQFSNLRMRHLLEPEYK